MKLQGKTALVTGSTSGIGLAIARALAFEGASVMINGFGDLQEIEAIRLELEASSGAQAHYDGADLGDATAIEAMIKRCGHELDRARHPGQQRRDPVRLPGRGLSGRQVGSDFADQPDCRVPHNSPLPAGDAGARLGQDHQHGVGAQPGRVAQQVGLCRGKTWRGRLHQDSRARGCARMASPSTASLRAMSGRRWSRTRSPIR